MQAQVNLVSLAELDVAAQLLHAQLSEHDLPCSEDTARHAMDGLLRDATRGFALIAHAPHPVGLAVVAFTWTVEHGGLVAWLDELYVVPSLRNRGIGRALLMKVIAETERAGCVALELEVDRDHGRAIHLYEREGFESLPRTRYTRKLSRGLGRLP
jgi:GNAT superfamily N-acetyltransferase